MRGNKSTCDHLIAEQTSTFEPYFVSIFGDETGQGQVFWEKVQTLRPVGSFSSWGFCSPRILDLNTRENVDSAKYVQECIPHD